MSKIQINRGLEADRSSITPSSGELIYTTDEKKLYIGDGSTAGGIAVIKQRFNEVFTASGGETTITIPNSKSYVVGSHELLVCVEGIVQLLTDEYTEDSSTTITLDTALSAGEKVVFRLL